MVKWAAGMPLEPAGSPPTDSTLDFRWLGGGSSLGTTPAESERLSAIRTIHPPLRVLVLWKTQSSHMTILQRYTAFCSNPIPVQKRIQHNLMNSHMICFFGDKAIMNEIDHYSFV